MSRSLTRQYPSHPWLSSDKPVAICGCGKQKRPKHALELTTKEAWTQLKVGASSRENPKFPDQAKAESTAVYMIIAHDLWRPRGRRERFNFFSVRR